MLGEGIILIVMCAFPLTLLKCSSLCLSSMVTKLATCFAEMFSNHWNTLFDNTTLGWFDMDGQQFWSAVLSPIALGSTSFVLLSGLFQNHFVAFCVSAGLQLALILLKNVHKHNDDKKLQKSRQCIVSLLIFMMIFASIGYCYFSEIAQGIEHVICNFFSRITNKMMSTLVTAAKGVVHGTTSMLPTMPSMSSMLTWNNLEKPVGVGGTADPQFGDSNAGPVETANKAAERKNAKLQSKNEELEEKNKLLNEQLQNQQLQNQQLQNQQLQNQQQSSKEGKQLKAQETEENLPKVVLKGKHLAAITLHVMQYVTAPFFTLLEKYNTEEFQRPARESAPYVFGLALMQVTLRIQPLQYIISSTSNAVQTLLTNMIWPHFAKVSAVSVNWFFSGGWLGGFETTLQEKQVSILFIRSTRALFEIVIPSFTFVCTMMAIFHLSKIYI